MIVDGIGLYLISHDVSLPLQMEIASTGIHTGAGTILECHELLRLLPGRRMVCRASFQGQTVIAKLFFHPDKSERDYEQERSGHDFFLQGKINTPLLLTSGSLNNRGFYVLYQYLESALSLGSRIEATPDKNSLTYINQLMPVLAAMHNAGFQQVDLHLNNFLVQKQENNNQIYTIDCGDVVSLSQSQQKAQDQRYKNLADILSQLPVIYDQYIHDFLNVYQSKSTTKEKLSIKLICKSINQWRQWRIRKYLKKTSRTCSEFICEKNSRQMRVYRRDHSSEAWLKLYSQLDRLVEQSPRLKDGNTATVALTECAGQKIVIKRYNIKHFRHWLGRFWRPSRAWRTWQNAQQLSVLGIKTPKPIAIVEQRFGWLRSKAFYLSEYEPAEDALTKYADIKDPCETEISAQHLEDFHKLFISMINSGMTHGDLKANNILLTEKGLSFIDLDAMTFHHHGRKFDQAFARDLKRFLRNWPEESKIYKVFAKMQDGLPRKPVC